MNYILNFFSNFCMTLVIIYFWYKLLKKDFPFNRIKIYIITSILAIISTFNFIFVNSFIRVTVITIILMFFFKYLFRDNFQKAILTPIFGQLVLMVAECAGVLILTFIFNSTLNSLLLTNLGMFIINMFITLIFILIIRIKIVYKIYDTLLKFTNKIKYSQFELVK